MVDSGDLGDSIRTKGIRPTTVGSAERAAPLVDDHGAAVDAIATAICARRVIDCVFPRRETFAGRRLGSHGCG